MMTFEQYLLTILAEECAEVAQRASKAARFGLTEMQDGQEFSNWQRLCFELDDLLGTVRYIELHSHVTFQPSAKAMAKKRHRIDIYANYSRELGKL